MRISYAWLTEYLRGGEVPPPEALAEMLTLAGLEVEAVEPLGAGLAGVVVGEVEVCEAHPDSDHLSICQVFDGTTRRQVICGAPNVRAGMRSAFAPPGTTLPGDFTIAVRTVRGVESAGMLCSSRELALSDEHEGILDLGRRAKVGVPLARHLGLEDTVLELGVTANRPDALSHVGVAREVAALTGLKLKPPRFTVAEKAGPVGEAASVAIEDPDRCARYVARVVEGVRIAPSPPWLVARLAAAGIRAINNVVDVTNFVLMELGQPLHAFDLDRLAGHRVGVRRARPGEKLRTLDDVERTLDADDLVIADGRDPIALAGVMGGGDSEVTDGTTRLLIESAWFEPTGVRRTARRHGLHTEASHRFERGADLEVARLAADRAAALIARLGRGRVREGVLDVFPRPRAPREVTLRYGRTDAVLGVQIPPATQRAILTRLGFKAARKDRGAVVWEVPSFRTEMDREIDLIEEVGRIHGYDEVPATLPTREAKVSTMVGWDRSAEVEGRLRDVASAAGCLEAVNYSFVSEADVAAMIPSVPGAPAPADRPEAHPVRLANPLSAEQAVMRTTVLTSLLGNLRSNRRFRETDLLLYELGRAYLRDDAGRTREPSRFAAVLSGRRGARTWAAPEAEVDFYDAKGLVEAALARLSIEGARFDHDAAAAPWLHPRSACVVRVGGRSDGSRDVVLGWLGEVHPVVADAFELPGGSSRWSSRPIASPSAPSSPSTPTACPGSRRSSATWPWWSTSASPPIGSPRSSRRLWRPPTRSGPRSPRRPSSTSTRARRWARGSARWPSPSATRPRTGPSPTTRPGGSTTRWCAASRPRSAPASGPRCGIATGGSGCRVEAARGCSGAATCRA